MEKLLGENILTSIFSKDQFKIIKRSVVYTEKLGERTNLAIMRIGNEINYLIYGKDLNDNTHYTMLSHKAFERLRTGNFKLGSLLNGHEKDL